MNPTLKSGHRIITRINGMCVCGHGRKTMTKADYLLGFLNNKRVPQDIIKAAIRDSKLVPKKSIDLYAAVVLRRWREKKLGEV